MERQLRQDEIDTIKRTEYQILKEIKRICINNDIEFFLTGGTLLGAIRHQGMIPWDDDIDIAMRREEYDKFLAVAEDELPEYMKLVNYHTCDTSGEPFSKIMDSRGKMVEIFTSTSKAPAGIFVDIFPMDHSPDNPIQRGMHRFRNYYLRKLILLNANYNFGKTGMKQVTYTVLKRIADCIGRKKLVQRYEANARKYNVSVSNYVVSLGGNYGYKKERLDVDIIERITWKQFEDDQYPVPEGYERYLTQIYGDYMQLPPPEKRVNKHKLFDLDLSGLNDVPVHEELK